MTIRNRKESPLLRLPEEIRLLIYGYAVYINCPIQPQQQERHSNRFFRGLGAIRWNRSANSQLELACFSIYNDLQRHPLFYRENEFLFNDIKCAQLFMAAITKQKRDAIRRITIHLTGVPRNSFAIEELLNPDRAENGHPIYHQPMRGYVNLEDVTPTSLESVLISGDHPLIPLFMEARDTLQSRKSFLTNHFNQQMTGEDEVDFNPRAARGQIMKDMLPAPLLSDAINDTGIHFPGEDRVAQDKMKSTIGAISSRTRQQVRLSRSVNQFGVIMFQPRPRGRNYDKEFLLALEDEVKEIRFRQDMFQCRLENKTDDQEFIHWVELDLLFTPRGLEALRKHYVHLFRLTSKRHATLRLQHVKEIPTPKRILAMARGWMTPLIQERPRSWAPIDRQWKHLQRKYARYVAGLEQN
ncbi:hypothetical protein SLS62_001463 [Diatrype stigma]|uniref:Uncharacterized protein n=1 Tax=Diatrype stigma TaxID=117547 RepID=A0AAN9UZ84_9PEZI